MTSARELAERLETPAQEFSRLVIEYNEGVKDSSERQEAWNLIADFALEHCDTILAALSQPVPGAASDEMVERARDIIGKGIKPFHGPNKRVGVAVPDSVVRAALEAALAAR